MPPNRDKLRSKIAITHAVQIRNQQNTQVEHTKQLIERQGASLNNRKVKTQQHHHGSSDADEEPMGVTHVEHDAEQLVVGQDGPPAEQSVALDSQAAPWQPIRRGEVDSLSAVDAWRKRAREEGESV